MGRKQIAIVQTTMSLGGGTEAVTAWMLEALKLECEVSLITYSDIDSEGLNLFYGTDLRKDQFSVIRPTLPRLLRYTDRFSVLKDHLMMRYCKSKGNHFDLFIGMGLAMDFGGPTVQYVGLAPGSALVKGLRGDPEMPGWYHLVKRFFMGACQRLSGFSQASSKDNVTLVNSKWTGMLLEEVAEVQQYEVVYPPVNGPHRTAPWSTRQQGFLCVARVVPEKRIEQVIEILDQVRRNGFDVSLHIVGRADDLQYYKRIEGLLKENATWLSMDGVLPQKELFSLMNRYQYGINAATDEPFGIAVAEMVKAGCIVFVADKGGQTEIVNSSQLCFSSTTDAVDKISQVLSNQQLQPDLLSWLDRQGEEFTTESFCQSTRRVVSEIFSKHAAV